MIRVLIASRSPLLRTKLETTLRASSLLSLAASTDPKQLLGSVDVWSDLSCDIILAEIDPSRDSEWRALAELPVPVVGVVDPSDIALVTALLRAGLSGTIPLDATVQEIEGAVYAASAGLVVSTRSFLSELLSYQPPVAEELPEPLSDREIDVLELLAEGLSNKLVAQALSISEHTVKTHVSSLFAKLGASSRTEVVSQAIRRGLVML